MSELAAKWLRVSSSGQDEANQEPDEDKWIDDHDYTLALAAGDRGVYRLHGRSASKGQHQALLDRAIADMKAGKYKVLIVWQSSRIERRGAWSVFDLIRRVHEAGGRIEFVQDSYLNESNEMSDVMLALAATKDRQKSRDIQKQTRAAHVAIDANGALRTKAPFGYEIAGEKKNKVLVPTKQGRELVPQVFQMIADGQGCQAVAAWLEKKTGRRCWAKTISSMIRQSAYYGDLKFQHALIDDKGNPVLDDQGNQVTVERVHRIEDPLVPFELWERANKRLDTVPRRGKATGRTHLLKGVAVCGACGGTLVRVDGNTRGVTPSNYLRCIGVPGKPDRHCGVTPAVTARAEAVERTVAALVQKLGYQPVVERTLVHGKNWDSEIRLTERRLRELHRQVDFTDPAYLTRQAELLAELADLRGRTPEPDRWEETETTVTLRDLWDACEDDTARNAFLRAQRFRVRLWRDRLEMTQGEPGGKSYSTVTVKREKWVKVGREAK